MGNALLYKKIEQMICDGRIIVFLGSKVSVPTGEMRDKNYDFAHFAKASELAKENKSDAARAFILREDGEEECVTFSDGSVTGVGIRDIAFLIGEAIVGLDAADEVFLLYEILHRQD